MINKVELAQFIHMNLPNQLKKLFTMKKLEIYYPNYVYWRKNVGKAKILWPIANTLTNLGQ